MKWQFLLIVCAISCCSLSSSAPFIQDDVAVMYPLEYYPAYMQYDYANLDITKWFKKAANSVKHFYNYVNSWIFGKSEGNESSSFMHFTSLRQKSEANTKILNENIPQGMKIMEIYRDSSGNVVVKNLNEVDSEIFKTQFKGIIQPKPQEESSNNSPSTAAPSNAPKNPFQWNEKLEKDELFAKVFGNYVVNPMLLWNSGIFPLQQMKAFNIIKGQQTEIEISDSNKIPQNQTSNQTENIQTSEKSDQTEAASPSTTTEVSSDQPATDEVSEEPQSDQSDKDYNPSSSSEAKETSYEAAADEESSEQKHYSNESDNDEETEPESDDSNNELSEPTEDSESSEKSPQTEETEETAADSQPETTENANSPNSQSSTKNVEITTNGSNSESEDDSNYIIDKVMAMIKSK